MYKYLIISALCLILTGCGGQPDTTDVRIFAAACFSSLLRTIEPEAAQAQKLNLQSEISGSQVACRKITELNRDCDVLMVADAALIKKIASPPCSWRIDFVHDEVVLGIGARAKYINEAEKDWTKTLQRKDVTLARVNPNLGPIGYRTLLVWQLKDPSGKLNIELAGKSEKTVDHVSKLSALLKAGDIDYAFVYRSTCVNNDIRYIPLDNSINLGDGNTDYSNASVSLLTSNNTATFKGAPITCALSIPDNAPHPEAAKKFVVWMLKTKQKLLKTLGFNLMKAKFYGTEEAYQPFRGVSEYGGELK